MFRVGSSLSQDKVLSLSLPLPLRSHHTALALVAEPKTFLSFRPAAFWAFPQAIRRTMSQILSLFLTSCSSPAFSTSVNDMSICHPPETCRSILKSPTPECPLPSPLPPLGDRGLSSTSFFQFPLGTFNFHCCCPSSGPVSHLDDQKSPITKHCLGLPTPVCSPHC